MILCVVALVSGSILVLVIVIVWIAVNLVTLCIPCGVVVYWVHTNRRKRKRLQGIIQLFENPVPVIRSEDIAHTGKSQKN